LGRPHEGEPASGAANPTGIVRAKSLDSANGFEETKSCHASSRTSLESHMMSRDVGEPKRKVVTCSRSRSVDHPAGKISIHDHRSRKRSQARPASSDPAKMLDRRPTIPYFPPLQKVDGCHA